MGRNWRCAIVSASFALWTSAAALAAPVVLDTEQKAADVWLSVASMQRSVEFDLDAITMDTRRFVLTSMQELAAITSPEALRALPAGVVVPCALGGSFRAKFKSHAPQVLHIEWSECAQFGDELYTSALSGPINVTLLTDTFTPDAVAAIRAGNATRDVTLIEHFEDTEFPQVRTKTYNYRMVGLISTARLFGRGLFIGPFSYRLNGFSREETQTAGFDPVIATKTAQGIFAKGSREYSDGNTVVTEVLHVVRGTMTTENASSWMRRVRSYTAQNFRTYNRIDFNDFITATADHTIDGRMHVEYVEGYPLACVNGEWTMKTKIPVHTPSLFTAPSEFDEGEILLNNSARVRFYARGDVPAGLPVPEGGMLTTIDVKNVGLFSYDSDASSANSIFRVAQCF